MYNVQDEIYTFYDRHVRLNREKQAELCEYRDRNIERLQTGLQRLGYNSPIRTCGQGSHAVFTMVQHPDNDYDLDTAAIFASEDLPSSPLKARQRVLAGIEEGGAILNNHQKPERMLSPFGMRKVTISILQCIAAIRMNLATRLSNTPGLNGRGATRMILPTGSRMK